MTTILVVLAIIVALGAVYFFVAKQSTEDASSPSDSKPDETSPLSSLPNLNLDIRKVPLPLDLIELVESIIDELITLVPLAAQSDSASGELAWTVNRIATEYLPNKCVYPYLALNNNRRSSDAENEGFRKNLEALKNELDGVSEVLLKKDQSNFAAKAKFLQTRFNTDTNGEPS